VTSRPKLVDKEINQEIEDCLLGLLDYMSMKYDLPDEEDAWGWIANLVGECFVKDLGVTLSDAGHKRLKAGVNVRVTQNMAPLLQVKKTTKPGAPTKLNTGAFDLLVCAKMHHAKMKNISVRRAANDLAEFFKELGWRDVSGETLRQRYLLLYRHGPTDSMLKAADSLWLSKRAGR
jgi:hypothetical protein